MTALKGATLQPYTTLACLGGTPIGTLSLSSASVPPTERRTRTGQDAVNFAVALSEPYVSALVPGRALRLTYTDGTWGEWRVDAETTTDGVSEELRTYRLKPILMDLNDGALCIDWTSALATSITGRMEQATFAEWWAAIVAPSLAAFGITHFALGTVTDPTRRYDFVFDGKSPYAASLAGVQPAGVRPKRIIATPNGTTNYLVHVLDRLDGGMATLAVAPNANLRRLQRQWETQKQATVIVPRGGVGGTADGTGIADNLFRVTASAGGGTVLTLFDPQFVAAPVYFPDQLNGLVARRLASDRHLPIVASDNAAGTITLGSAPASGWHADAVDGELVQIRATAPTDAVPPAPDASRQILLTRHVRSATDTELANGLDWRLGSVNTGAKTAMLTHPYTQIAATFPDTIPATGMPDLQAAEEPVDRWVRTASLVFSAAGAKWALTAGTHGADSYAFDDVTWCASDGYCASTLPVGIQVGDVLLPTTYGLVGVGSTGPGVVPSAYTITAIDAGRGWFRAVPLYPDLIGPSLGPAIEDVEVWRWDATWVQVEAFNRATGVLTFGAGFTAAVAAGKFTNGAAVGFARNGVGRGLIALSDPASVAAYGQVVRTVDGTTVTGVRNLHPDPYFRDWPSGAVPHGWTVTSGPAPTKDLSAVYQAVGGAAMVFDHAGATGSTSIVRSRVVRLEPGATECALRVPYYLAGGKRAGLMVTLDLLDVTGGESDFIAGPLHSEIYDAALKVDTPDEMTLSHVPVPPGMRMLQVRINITGLGVAKFALRGFQATSTGEPPAMTEASGSNTHYATAHQRLARHADPRVAAAAWSLALTDRFREDQSAYPLEALVVDRALSVADSRVGIGATALEIVELTVNLRDEALTDVQVGLPGSDLGDDL